MRKKSLFIAILSLSSVIIIGVTSCKREKGCKEWEQTPIEPQALLNIGWECVGFVNVKSCIIRKCGNSIVFGEDGKLGGASCNILCGNYNIDFITGNINISIGAVTQVLCPPEMNEDIYLETLNNVHFFSLQGNELRLYYNNNKNYLLFKGHQL